MAEIGKGYGSECHLLRWMGRHRHAFDEAVRQALGKTSGAVDWLDFHFEPRRAWADAELKGLKFVPDQTIQMQWSKWWPQGHGIHNWDAVGWWGDRAAKELVLVEAKAHLSEIRSSCKATSVGSLALIKEALAETAHELNVLDIDPWLCPHYQLANRLAAVHFLRTCGYQPHLVLVYFVGDKGASNRDNPKLPAEWAVPLSQQKAEMGLTGHPLPSVHELFLHVSEPSAWLKPDPASRIGLGWR